MPTLREQVHDSSRLTNEARVTILTWLTGYLRPLDHSLISESPEQHRLSGEGFEYLITVRWDRTGCYVAQVTSLMNGISLEQIAATLLASGTRASSQRLIARGLEIFNAREK